MKIERRNFITTELRMSDNDGGTRTLTGHAAVFESRSQDLGGFVEEIAAGAFTQAIANDDVRALFNHDSNFVLGRNKANTLRLSEDATGLKVEIDMPDTQYARDLSVSIDRGDVSQMSFGFTVKPDGQSWGEDGDQTVRRITNVNLMDVSPVTYPAYLDTDVAVREMRAWSNNNKVNLDSYKMKIELAEK